MMRELLNFLIFIRAIAEVLAMTGVGVGVVIALVAERYGFRIVALGFEVSGDGRLAEASKQQSSRRGAVCREDWATSPSRKVSAA